MKKVYLILLQISCFYCFSGIAQHNPTIMYNEHFQTLRTRYEPSNLGTNEEKFEVNVFPLLFNFHAWAGNNFINLKDINKWLNDEITTTDLNRIVGDLKKDNSLGLGTFIQLFSTAVTINKPGETEPTPLFTVSFEVNERIEGNLFFPKELAEVVWQGNANFVGQTVDIGRIQTNGFYNREFVLGGAMDVWENDLMKVRAGLRLKYIKGLFANYTEQAKGQLTTAADSSYLDLTTNYIVHTAGFPEDDEDITGDFFTKGSGGGFGIDLGGTVTFKENIKGSLHFLDIGSVKYKRRVNNYMRADTTVRFEGIDAEGENAQDFFDTIDEDFNTQETSNAFRMPLPARMVLQGEYTLPINNANAHKFFFTYTQGFRKLGIATTRPQVSLGYVYKLGKLFNGGVAPTFGGYNRFALGTFASIRAGGFRFGVGSTNIISALGFNSGTMADFNFNLGLSIHQFKKAFRK